MRKFIEQDNNEERTQLFVSYISAIKDTTFYIELWTLFDDKFWLFLNVFANRFCDLPKVSYLKRRKKESDIYYEMMDSSLSDISDKYDETRKNIKRIGQKVRERLEDYEPNVDTEFFQMSFEDYKESTDNG